MRPDGTIDQCISLSSCQIQNPLIFFFLFSLLFCNHFQLIKKIASFFSTAALHNLDRGWNAMECFFVCDLLIIYSTEALEKWNESGRETEIMAKLRKKIKTQNAITRRMNYNLREIWKKRKHTHTHKHQALIQTVINNSIDPRMKWLNVMKWLHRQAAWNKTNWRSGEHKKRRNRRRKNSRESIHFIKVFGESY